MKLKKIASLALAGAMAVSMLAGCGTDSSNSTGNNTTDNGTVVVPASGVAEMLNNNQDPAAKAQVKFSADSSFEKLVSQAAEEVGFNGAANASAILTELKKMVNADAYSALGTLNTSTNLTANTTFLDGDKIGSDDVAKHEGQTQTLLVVQYLNNTNYPSGLLSADVAAYESLKTLKTNLLGNLPAETNTTALKRGDNYLTYDYTGKVCVVSTMQNTGAPAYYIAYLVTQTSSVATIEK